MPIRGSRLRSVVLSTGVAVVLCVPLAISVAAGATDETLISKGRPAVASSARGSGQSGPAAADGNRATRWVSAAGAGTQWLRLDLGALRAVDRVRLRWAAEYATAYRVQTSGDGASWTDVYVTRSGDGGTDDLKRLHGEGRYVRILATLPARGGSGYSLSEMQAFGPRTATPLAAPAGSALLAAGLDVRAKKETALQLVSSAENSTLAWRGQFGYIEDIRDGRGYTAGIVGFCSGTSDMLEVVTEYTKRKPSNPLARYLPALRTVDGSDSHAGLDPYFPDAWRMAATDPIFQKVQEDVRDWMYFDPSLLLAKQDGLRALGQFAYYDAAVMHGVSGLRGIRAKALATAEPPARGGDELVYLNVFLDARVVAMRAEEAHSDVSRVDTAQRQFLKMSNLDLDAPLNWRVYGDKFRIARIR
jgi:chitosanase